MPSPEIARPAAASPRSLSGLLPFIRPYRGRVGLALVFLVFAALSTLAFPVALKGLIDQGLVSADPGERVLALRDHFLALFAVGIALGVFSAARFYMVSWLGERITADVRSAVYAHVVRQSPEFFESTQTGEVLSRLTTDTTLVQTVVGSSLSMGLRNAVMGAGALAMLVITNPYVMTQVLGILVLVVLPSLYVRPPCAPLEPRQPGSCRRFERHRRRGAERGAGGAELHPGAARGGSLRAVHRTRLRGRAQAHAGALVPGGLHHQRHLRRAAVGAVPGHAGGDAGRHQRRPPGADGGAGGDPGRQRGGAVRGLWRPAARRRCDRTADGTAGGTFAGARSAGAARAAGGQRRFGRAPAPGALPLPVAPAAGHAARLLAAREGRRDRGAGRPQRGRQEHGAAAAAALLRRAVGQRRDRRRAGAAGGAARAAPAHRHRAAGQQSSSRPARWRTSATAAPRPATTR